MVERWRLSRAGIVNVYQYGDETLEFRGGRLLLRGVNGSGKSTAMNMLLPFLLDADTRRIDAAGEQARVLHSWMLSGRDEQQPVGYLWIEFRRGDDYLTCGCGIRANRSTDRVTTWWFVTPRRPGIDLSLVENRTPLAVDALRATLGSHAVFAQDQRQGYRNSVREQLFGGADVDQHIRLLHVVRNPRVGDRIDLDLPSYLEDALPQLSERALDDAAQPLEDLEEHRRNVEDLTRTAGALDALDVVYRSYARAELHQRADHLLGLVNEHAGRARDEAAARKSQGDAEIERENADGAVTSLEAEEGRLQAVVDALKESDAYRQGAELNELRKHVVYLGGQIEKARANVASSNARHQEARREAETSRHEADGDLDALTSGLSDLAALAVTVGLPQRPPAALVVDTQPSPIDAVSLPTGPIDVEPTRVGLGRVRAGLTARLSDIAEVRKELAEVARAEQAVTSADAAVQEAEAAESDALRHYTEARHDCDLTVEAWRSQLGVWLARLDAHRREEGLAAADAALLVTDDLAADRDEVVERLHGLLQATVVHHQGLAAKLTARRDDQREAADELERRLAELQAKTLPDPPTAAWQEGARRPCLAELVDFAPDLDASTRAGLEAALEASGLLSAEVGVDGDLTLADGQLVAIAGEVVAHPLRDLLTVAVPDELQDQVDARVVERVLRSLSTRHSDVAAVSTDGRFRMGALFGRHTKAEAEHVGVGARRAALARQRAAAKAELDAARDQLTLTEADLARRQQLLGNVEALRRDLPSAREVNQALGQVELRERLLDRARDLLDSRRGEHREAESILARAVDTAHRIAADHGLPADHDGLSRITDGVNEARGLCNTLDSGLRAIIRSVGRWIADGAACDRAAADLRTARQELADLQADHGPQQARLTTLEATIGSDYDEVVRRLQVVDAERRQTSDQLKLQRESKIEAHKKVERLAGAVETAAERRHDAEHTCVAAIPLLRSALTVPGLVPAAAHRAAPLDPAEAPEPVEEPAFPVVADTPEGARHLARAVHAAIPPADATATSSESVRQSLRQRRDSLGAGWDAEDRQPDQALPLFVEVTGPLGRMPLHAASTRVAEQLRSMAGLLSAKQDQALRNLLQGLVAREVALKLQAAKDLVELMNRRLDSVTTSHGIGVSLRWRRRDDLDGELADTIRLLAKLPDLRTPDEERRLAAAVAERVTLARSEDPEASYRDLIARVLDYRAWHRMSLLLHRPGRDDEVLSRRTALSEGEKKMVSYLPLFAAVAASCDALAEHEGSVPRFVLLDDAFAKVSEDNHAKLFGLLVDMELDFVATSERLWGTHATVPELAITEVIRDATLGVIVLEHSRWDGRERTVVT